MPAPTGPPTANGATAGHRTPEQALARRTFSWLDPHPIFVMILVGPDEVPFGIQKDFICHKSSFYRHHFEMLDSQMPLDTVEHVVYLPDAAPEVFALAQHFMYTGDVFFSNIDRQPSYDVLISTWKLAHDLDIEGLCEEVLEAMKEVRRVTSRIPAAPVLTKVWEETQKGSSLRKLLLGWAAEYMTVNNDKIKAEFAESLPKEVTCDLLVQISSPRVESLQTPVPATCLPPALTLASVPEVAPRKVVHYLEDDSDNERQETKPKKSTGGLARGDIIPINRRASNRRASLRNTREVPNKRRSSGPPLSPDHVTVEQKLNFCSDLITRMLSGPGFWTRLVGPFKVPVDPSVLDLPDYFDKIKRPMDLSTVKDKCDRGEYGDEVEFAADVRQVFKNCYTYWNKGDDVYEVCERLEKTFEEKYSQMTRWISKMGGAEA